MTSANDKNHSRIALITGANKGIGFEVARQLGQKGIQVLIGSRDEARGTHAVEQLTAEELSATMIQIDVTDQASIDLAVSDVENAYGRLDILVNNSGVYLKEPRPSGLTMELLRNVFDVNFFGAFAVTKAFLPLLRQSADGRIVNVSSGLGTFNFHATNKEHYFQCAYSASKAALNMLTVQLAKDLKGTKIKVNACTPGLTATDLTNFHGHTVEIGAKSTVFLATLPDDGPSGKYFGHDCIEDKW